MLDISDAHFSILWSNLYAKLPFINDCQKSVCHFTDAKIQYAFLHKMPFYTTAFLHYFLLTPLPIYTTAFLHYCQYTGEPTNVSNLMVDQIISYFSAHVV